MFRIVKVNSLRTAEQRAGVVYVGRAFAGWPASKWGNPFRPRPGFDAVKAYEDWFRKLPNAGALLWELIQATDCGEKPLGCWCVDATLGDGQPEVCHAQLLWRLATEATAVILAAGTARPA